MIYSGLFAIACVLIAVPSYGGDWWARVPKSQDRIIRSAAIGKLFTWPMDGVQAFTRSIRARKFRHNNEIPEDFKSLANWNTLREVAISATETQTLKSSSLDQSFLFDFKNDQEDFQDIAPRTLGYCWGYSNLLRRFKYLAHFDAQAPKASLDEIDGQIKNLLRLKSAHFSGYRDLLELSRDEAVAPLLKKAVVKNWKRLAVSLNGIQALLRSQNDRQIESQEKVLEQVNELKRKLLRGETPLLMFFHTELRKYVHVVPVYEVRPEKDEAGPSYRLCFIDSHGTVEQHEDCGKSLVVHSDGRLWYPEWDTIYGPSQEVLYQNKTIHSNVKWMQFTPEDDFENFEFLKQWWKISLRRVSAKLSS